MRVTVPPASFVPGRYPLPTPNHLPTLAHLVLQVGFDLFFRGRLGLRQQERGNSSTHRCRQHARPTRRSPARPKDLATCAPCLSVEPVAQGEPPLEGLPSPDGVERTNERHKTPKEGHPLKHHRPLQSSSLPGCVLAVKTSIRRFWSCCRSGCGPGCSCGTGPASPLPNGEPSLWTSRPSPPVAVPAFRSAGAERLDGGGCS